MLHVAFLTLLRALEVNIDLRHVNHIRYYYYYFTFGDPEKSRLLIEILDVEYLANGARWRIRVNRRPL